MASGNIVYVIGNKQERVCKIGVSNYKCFKERVGSIQTGCPYQIEKIMTIDCQTKTSAFKLEQALHRAFRDSKLNGEWFRITQEIAAFLDTVMAKGRVCPAMGCVQVADWHLDELERFLTGAPWTQKKDRDNDVEFWKAICYELRKQVASLNQRISIINEAVSFAAVSTKSLSESARTEAAWLSHGVFESSPFIVDGEALDRVSESEDLAESGLSKMVDAIDVAENVLMSESDY